MAETSDELMATGRMAHVRDQIQLLTPEQAKEAFILMTWTTYAPTACMQAIEQAKTMVKVVPAPDAYA